MRDDTPVLDRPRLLVDFNAMVDPDRVLLSREDTKLDSAGNIVELHEGLRVYVYTPDVDDDGTPTNLIATGIVELDRANDWSARVKWCCRIDRWHA
ncbi:MAG: hypothetical protein HOV81_34810 [Kofleriaceae bacterium]|nr:hypothetical protein [Kofleriaceae bacterium]